MADEAVGRQDVRGCLGAVSLLSGSARFKLGYSEGVRGQGRARDAASKEQQLRC